MGALPAGRPTWAEIDLAALRWNFGQVRKLVGRTTRILAVVKANAYGHGAVACSRVLAAAGVDQLGVATVEEGRELREAGIRKPLVVFGLVQPQEAAEVARLGLAPTVVSAVQVRALAQAARRRGRRLGVHVKVDTGMGRIGIHPEETGSFVRWLLTQPGLSLAGVFTHFANADGGDRTLLRRQIKLQCDAAQAAREAGGRGFAVHMANSAAVMETPEAHADMVRPGLMLYGLYPAPRLRRRAALRPVLSWRTRIIQVKQVPAGTGLSYGHTFTTRRPSRIATLPVGYADGYSRGLSNRGTVLVRGRECPVVGRVCMDMCLADVTGLGEVQAGEEAVLIGRQGRQTLGAERMAGTLKTISYEVVSTIGSRVPRRFQGGRV
ncbi:MAG: alanine racemase [candidate division FCPU426 bacterium]